VNPSYLYRSGPPNELDRIWAEKLGESAIQRLAEGMDRLTFLSIQKSKSGFRVKDIQLSQIETANTLHRHVDENFYDPIGLRMTENGKRYFNEFTDKISLNKSYGFEI